MIFGRSAQLEARVSSLEGQLAEANDTIRLLVSQIVEMKREGFQPPAPFVDMEPTDVLPAEVMAAIDARGTTRQVRERLLTFARGALGAVEADEVATKIRDGDTFAWGA